MKDLFCTKCAKVTSHTGHIDGNGEYLFFCTEVMVEDAHGNQVGHHFVKFPAVKDAAELEYLIAKHEEVNKATAEKAAQDSAQNDILNEVLGDGTNVTVSETVTDAPATPTK